ncbi:fluoride efflux transporter CrcB [Bradyrhizobium sp. WYCCWR 13023]|uniref:Fluoride-specific ion channel FluC n=1 Tax=Bradyrhizobium zhengyangense TaxID=2911009 RepID=A0A9X1U5W0_9BRAD|nr:MULTISPECIES: fluoride efflux transporter CrcB [Bradyrhizobium]MCG2625186.1 fluoride efflux transporter CrcB [Bradyrhizobium zhengyangense]MCG2641627.1 fluoride efflux transporter CrcB [Bradyrhizobium zhengyangense]MCG2667254.1 fluoride efflux transporter CrcB [Bradyrhizobium zhengyangense]MDA9523835.1 protein CrcB [Bradyrhizobium sp. CCBAU 11434]
MAWPWRTSDDGGLFIVLSGAIAIVVGSVLGGCARYFVSGAIARRLGETFPWGTMTINVTGAFLIGILGALATHPGSMFATPNPWLFAVTGFLGCYTTVSSFSLQTLTLARNGEPVHALGNVVFSVGLCLAAVSCGFLLADSLGG